MRGLDLENNVVMRTLHPTATYFASYHVIHIAFLNVDDTVHNSPFLSEDDIVHILTVSECG